MRSRNCKPRLVYFFSALLGLLFTLMAILIPASLPMNIPFIDLSNFSIIHLTVPTSVVCIALLGIANALVWPAIWPLAIDGLGKHTETASALLIMAIVGGALLPKLYGMLAESSIGYRSAYWIMVPCYLFIGWYSLSGHKRKSWKSA